MRGETLSSEEEKQILNSLSKSGTEEVDAEPLAVSAPQANAYEFQSQEVVDVLQKLVDKFDKERETIGKEEVNAKHNYEMLNWHVYLQVPVFSLTTSGQNWPHVQPFYKLWLCLCLLMSL